MNLGLERLTEDLTNTELFSQMFDDFPSGVMVLNVHTVLVYYNQAQGLIDDLKPRQAIGKTILELYRVGDNTNYPTLLCLFARRPLIDYPCFYYTHRGKLINSIHSVFPLMKEDKLRGCICFIREYGEIAGQYQKVADLGKKADHNASKNKPTLDQIITQNQIMRQSLDIVARAANSPSPIMLYGETGCGKEMYAQSIHNISRRRDKSFLALNCAAIPESLLEGLLFGTVKGAFTGALDKPGMMEMADGGTIFLDEINSMPLGLQSKMLRVIQEQKIRRVGGSNEKQVSLKIVSASNVHPQKAVTDGQLRSDLLFRLGVVMVYIPPLRERREDIPVLTKHFLKKLNQRICKKVTGLAPALEKAFEHYHWPGNVRELEHAIEGAMNIIPDDETILEPSHFASSLFGGVLSGLNLNVPDFSDGDDKPASTPLGPQLSVDQHKQVERLIQALENAGGNAAKAARKLNISPQLMNYKMKKFGLKKKVTVKAE